MAEFIPLKKNLEFSCSDGLGDHTGSLKPNIMAMEYKYEEGLQGHRPK